MEEQGILDPDNELHIMSLHKVVQNEINSIGLCKQKKSCVKVSFNTNLPYLLGLAG